MKIARTLCLIGVSVAFLSSCDTIHAWVFGEENRTDSELPAVEAAVSDPLAYETEFQGQLSDTTREVIEKSSALITEAGRLPASVAALKARVDSDVARVKQILASEGYFEPDVSSTIDADVEPAQVLIRIDPGPLYHLAVVDIRYEPAEPIVSAPETAADLGLSIGQPAAGAPLVDASRRLVRQLREQGYPHARLVGTRYLADRDADTISALWTVDVGPFARFGELRINGLEDLDPDYLQRTLQWKPDTPFDVREIERVREALAKTRLFETITPPTLEEVGVTDGKIPVAFTVDEGPSRSIGFGLYYSTDEQGPGGSVSWEHRNLFGNAESLRLRLEGSLIRQSATAKFRKPAFLREDQAIVGNLDLERSETDAYEGITLNAFAGVERQFLDHWTVTAGPALFYADITESAGDEDGERYLLGGGQATVAYDSRDDKLNPSRGLNGSVGLSPFSSLALTSTEFAIANATLAGYQGIGEDDRIVLAARLRAGSIFGASQSKVPASLRFYSGGGGSVRGYEYQSIGPLADDDPTGGRSVVEVNAEVRIKIIDEFGVVPFIDGGQVYEQQYPELGGEELQWAAGTGLRYYSPVGPIRFDVAFPLNPRDRDDVYQFYISIGQAF
jgi:translocation and assembly module TamA